MALPLYQGTPEYFPAQRSLTPARVAVRPRRRQMRIFRQAAALFTIGLAFLVVLKVIHAGVEIAESLMRRSANAPVWSTGQPVPATVSATNARARLHDGYLTITGVAVNRGAVPLHNVEVEAVLKNRVGAVVGLEQALLPHQVIMPGKQCPFRLDMHSASGTTSFTLHFHELLGRDLG